MFLIEAFPAVIMGLAVLFYLPDSPKTASFLTADERSWLASKIDSERQAQETVEHFSVKKPCSIQGCC